MCVWSESQRGGSPKRLRKIIYCNTAESRFVLSKINRLVSINDCLDFMSKN